MIVFNENEIRVGQLCFPCNGYMLCNFVIKNGKKVVRKNGGYLKFPLRNKKKQRRKKENVVSLIS